MGHFDLGAGESTFFKPYGRLNFVNKSGIRARVKVIPVYPGWRLDESERTYGESFPLAPGRQVTKAMDDSFQNYKVINDSDTVIRCWRS